MKATSVTPYRKFSTGLVRRSSGRKSEQIVYTFVIESVRVSGWCSGGSRSSDSSGGSSSGDSSTSCHWSEVAPRPTWACADCLDPSPRLEIDDLMSALSGYALLQGLHFAQTSLEKNVILHSRDYEY